MNFSDVREALKDKIKEDSKSAFHVLSDFCWYRYELYVDELAKKLPYKANILDAGCGWGHVSAMLAKQRPDLEISAIDVRPSVSWKKLKKFKVKYKFGDVTNIKFKDNTFDAVMSLGVLEHVPNYVKFVTEVNRVLKPDGIFYIFNLPNKFSIIEFVARIIGIFYHKCRFTMSEITRILSENGFEVLDVRMDAFIPSQLKMINKSLGSFSDNNYVFLQNLDDFINKTPLRMFSEAIIVVCRKAR